VCRFKVWRFWTTGTFGSREALKRLEPSGLFDRFEQGKAVEHFEPGMVIERLALNQ
jgi:hypothetical protein